MKLPLVIRSGIQFKPEETLAIEFAAVYEHWSRSEETRIEDVRAPLTLNSTATAFAPEGFDPEVPIEYDTDGKVIKTLNLKAQTLNCKPRDTQPQTICPKPQTLNPDQQSLNLKT